MENFLCELIIIYQRLSAAVRLVLSNAEEKHEKM